MKMDGIYAFNLKSYAKFKSKKFKIYQSYEEVWSPKEGNPLYDFDLEGRATAAKNPFYTKAVEEGWTIYETTSDLGRSIRSESWVVKETLNEWWNNYQNTSNEERLNPESEFHFVEKVLGYKPDWEDIYRNGDCLYCRDSHEWGDNDTRYNTQYWELDLDALNSYINT